MPQASALLAACPLTPWVAWGNVGSALNGAAIVLGQLRPELGTEIYRITSAVLARPPLSLTDPVAGSALPPGQLLPAVPDLITGRDALCGDCVLIRR